MSKQLKIIRVMGTSAGAIVGAMIAANIDIEKFRSDLKEKHRSGLLKELKNRWAADLRQAKLGTPYWKSGVLRNLIKDTFNAVGVKTVEDVSNVHGVDLRIVATDLALA
jgi:predicted acylesterase/phospholipase RssA